MLGVKARALHARQVVYHELYSQLPFKSNNDWGGSVIVFLIYRDLGHED